MEIRRAWDTMDHGKFVQYSDDEQKLIFGSTVSETGFSFSVSVSLAMSEEQALRLGRGTRICIRPDLPDSDKVYYCLWNLPRDKVKISGDSWERIVEIPRENIADMMDILYPDGLDERYWKIISAIEGDTIRLIGFGD